MSSILYSSIFLYRTLVITLFTVLHFYALANWTPLQTDIHDNLTGVAFWDQSGVVSGEKGIYYTLTGGQGSTAWHRFEITNNTQDAALYNRCRFNHCNSFNPDITGDVYVCGEDTVNHKAIILRVQLPSLNYVFLYTGQPNTALNHIGFNPANGDYYAVGDNGLVIKVSTGIASIIPNSMFFDLLSIAIFNNNFWIGADHYRVWGVDISTFNPTILQTEDRYADVVFRDNTYAFAVGDRWYQRTNGTFVTPDEDFDFGPLNAKAIVKEDSYYFVATDHGIFRTLGDVTPSVLEWQPSAGSFNYEAFWSDPLSKNLYAAGKDGLLMVTSDYGGKTKPFVRMRLLPGACVKAYQQFQAPEIGSSTTCKWYVNNKLIKSGCSFFAEKFDTAGFYHAELQTYNGTYRDTFAQDFYVVNKPTIDLPILISDTTICKDQSIEITLSNTQPDVFYSLFKIFGNDEYFFGSSSHGDPGIVTFNSLPIAEKGLFYLRSSSSIADCEVDFKEPLPLTIELTSADFRPAAWNLKPGEDVLFYENTIDASHFDWTFSSSSNIQHSILPNPITSFNDLNAGEIRLIASSDYGCIDTITKPAPKMYIPPDPPDHCWINQPREPDTMAGDYDAEISELRPSKTGYFICGQYKDMTFPTQHGDSLKADGRGCFIAKYDYDGTIKWFMKTRREDILFSYNDPEYTFSLVEDEEENVYVSGVLNSYGSPFFDNSGKTFRIDGKYFLMKLDKHGKLLWFYDSRHLRLINLTIDHDGNLCAAAYNSPDNPIWFKNGLQPDTLIGNPGANAMVMKISPEGEVIWHASVFIYGQNFNQLTQIQVDLENNLYIVGGCEYRAVFYSAGNPVGDTMSLGSTSLFLVKYDTEGKYLWGIKAATSNILLTNTYPYSLVTDDIGNSYISGLNACNAAGCLFAFENADHTTTSISAGEYFVAKVNRNGICEWINGAAYTFYGKSYGASLYGDEVSFIGEFQDQLNNNDVLSAHLTSRTGPGIDLSITEGDFFISVYDTTGILRRLYVNGFNKKGVYYDGYVAAGIFQLADGSYYMAKDLELHPGPYTLFGEPLLPTIKYDGYVAHFDPSCAVVYWPGYNRVDTVYVCAGTTYTFPDGETRIIENATIQSSHFTGAEQDSTIITNVKITEPLDINVVMHGDTLVSLAENVQYQWLDCDHGYSPINGATEPEFQPTSTGHYAVRISGAYCVDTSACDYVVFTGNSGPSEKTPIHYFPNPTYGKLYLDFGVIQGHINYLVTDITGKILQHAVLKNVEHTELIMPEENGMYIIHLALDDGRYEVIRIVRL